MILLIVLIIFILILLLSNIRIINQSKVAVVERLGRFKTVWQAGIHVKTPFIEKVVRTVSLKEQVLDFPPQPVSQRIM